MDAPYDGTEVTIVSEEPETGHVLAVGGPPKKKKKYKGVGDQGDRAKRPRSAYLLYYYDIYLKIQQDLPNLPQSEINKKISESWRLLSVAEKSYYLEKAKLEKEGQDPNFKSTSYTAVPEIPGFRKILPRSDYIIIPGSTLHEDSRQHVEVHVVQGRCAKGGRGEVGSRISSLLSETEQSLLSFDPQHPGLTEQVVAIEGLAEAPVSFQQSDVVQEVVASEILSHYLSTMNEKGSRETMSDKTTLKPQEGEIYVATSLAMEDEATDSTTRVPCEGMNMVRSKTEDGVSVLTLMTERAADNYSPSASNQYIVLPVPTRTTSEMLTSIKLATTYTRRGRGNCTNSSCSYTYVTRHKPPRCPLCDTFLGGKWITKEKSKGTHAGLTDKPGVQRSSIVPPQPMTEDRSTPGSAEESLAAVSQLLRVVPGGEKPQETEWEEVIISEAHILQNDAAKMVTTIGGLVTHIENSPEACPQPPVDGSGSLNADVDSVGKAVEIHSSHPTTSPKLLELRNKSRARPALMAATRPTRAILPAPVCSSRELVSENLIQKPAFLKNDIHSHVRATGLKLSTLKQLGHLVQLPSKPEEKKVQVVAVNNISPPPPRVLEVKPHVFPSYKYSCAVTLDLGLATSRGRGKCKNPDCSYVYTNRHKPPFCPNCGFNLAKERIEKAVKPLNFPLTPPDVLDICNPLSQSQKETQRMSTLQLLRKVVQIPENESELAEVLALIHELNSSRFVLSDVSEETVTIEQTSWSNYYESPAIECLLCGSPLFKGEKDSLAGPLECWLLTANKLQVVTAQVKMCLNPQCLALHSFTDIYTGLFNLGNKLLVSLDLLFTIRNHLKLGEDPNTSVRSILRSVQEQTEKNLCPEEELILHELLSNSYWAFECLTIRDYNDMICGVCGIAPKIEIAQRNMENALSLKNIEFTWPEFPVSGEVNVEDFWLTMEMEVIEQAAFPSGIPITKFDAAIIAPFFAPLLRGSVVVNTEKDKNLEQRSVPGNGSALVRLLHDGSLKLEQIDSYGEKDLQHFLTLCEIPWTLNTSKDKLISSLEALHAFVQNGSGAKQPPQDFTGGKVYKICPHQVVSGSKYIVRGESACDHVDLLVSSRHWPPVYVVDIATQVALRVDTCYPELATQMWGQDQGCFSNPMEPPKYVSAPELLDQHYNVDMTVAEPSLQHPVTKSTCRRIVHAGGEQSSHINSSARHRSLSLCRELEPYEAIITAINDSKTSMVRQQVLTFDNATHYYLYNRLIDFLTSREIVNRQIHEIVQSCQPGEVVIRDTLYRLGVAQIKTEDSMDEEEGEDEEKVKTAAETFVTPGS
ncbi:HMG domain-containing protein 3 isoform X1 [Lissotriton helveticus]